MRDKQTNAVYSTRQTVLFTTQRKQNGEFSASPTMLRQYNWIKGINCFRSLAGQVLGNINKSTATPAISVMRLARPSGNTVHQRAHKNPRSTLFALPHFYLPFRHSQSQILHFFFYFEVQFHFLVLTLHQFPLTSLRPSPPRILQPRGRSLMQNGAHQQQEKRHISR